MITVKIKKVLRRIGALSGLVGGAVEHIMLSGPRVKRERYTAYRLLSQILSKELGCDAESLTLDFDENGRPYLLESGRRSGIDFSISHSGELVLVAVSDSSRVGADLQIEVSEECGGRLDKRFALSSSIAPLLEKTGIFGAENYREAAKFLTGPSMSFKKAPEKIMASVNSSETSDKTLASANSSESPDNILIFANSKKANALPCVSSLPPCREPNKTVLWATAEAALKCDGRGFSAYSQLGQILPEIRVFCTSFVYRDKKYAGAIAFK